MATDRPTRRQLIRGAAALGLSAALGDVADAFAAPGAAPADVRTLADILPIASWDTGSRGPLLIVDPAGTERVRDENGTPANLPEPDSTGRVSLVRSLTAFDRRPYPMGTLTVIAPTEMTVVSDEPPREPILWAGLRPDEKLSYLVSLLTPTQFEKLASDAGLGATDLSTQEQRDAFLLLLPDPFKTRTGTLDARGSIPYPGEQRTLSADERSAIRIRMQMTLSFMVPFVSQPGAMAGVPSGYSGQPGDRATVRDNTGAFDSKGAFGVDIATRTPNRLKPSNLAYDTDARLAIGLAVASLPAMATVRDLAAAAAAATTIELIADFRVAGLAVDLRGTTVRTGDLLKAMAIAVCGTWRRIGGTETYVLTADRTGAGARKLRLADWYADLDVIKDQHVRQWQDAAIAAGLGRYVVARPSTVPLSPGPDLEKQVAAAEPAGNGVIPTSDLTPQMREHLRQMAVMYNRQSSDWDREHVRAHRDVTAQFLLPDGTPVVGDDDLTLGSVMAYTRPRTAPKQPDDDHPAASRLRTMLSRPGMPQPPYTPAIGGRAIVVSALTAEDAAKSVSMARRYRFSELWVRTDDPAVVAVAIARAASDARTAGIGVAPVAVWAAASVFAAGGGTADAALDRNVIGETGPQAASARKAAARWTSLVSTATLMANTEPNEADFSGPPATVPPVGAAWAARADRLAALASVPGLAGLALDPRFPSGYEAEHSLAVEGGYDAPSCARADMGYSVDMRLGFLRSEAIDPIDLIPDNLMFPGDLRTPFFLDDRARGMTTVYNGRDRPAAGFADKTAAWNAFRSLRRLDALTALRSTIAGRTAGLNVLNAAMAAAARVNGPLPIYGPASAYFPWSTAGAAVPQGASNSDLPGQPSTSLPSSAAASLVFAPASADGSATDDTEMAAFLFIAATTSPPIVRFGGGRPQPKALDLSRLTPAATAGLLARWVTPTGTAASPASPR